MTKTISIKKPKIKGCKHKLQEENIQVNKIFINNFIKKYFYFIANDQ